MAPNHSRHWITVAFGRLTVENLARQDTRVFRGHACAQERMPLGQKHYARSRNEKRLACRNVEIMSRMTRPMERGPFAVIIETTVVLMW